MATTWTIRRDRLWRPLLPIIGVVGRRSWVKLDEDAIEICFGWFRTTVPLDAIHSAEAMDWPLIFGIGLRIGPRSTLACVGSHRGVVVLRLRNARRFRVPFPLWRERLAVSLEDPGGFVEAVSAAIGAGRA